VPALGGPSAAGGPALRARRAVRVAMGGADGRAGGSVVGHSAAAASSASASADAVFPLPLHRPAWLLPEPLPLAVQGALPLLDGRQVQLVSGPERIEAGWWDGGLAARDYFIGQADDGSLLWLWRGRLPTAPGEAQWFLQGRFA